MTLLFMKGMVRICGKLPKVEEGRQHKGWWVRLLIPALFVILFAWWSMPRYTETYIPWPNFTPLRVASADRVVLDLPINMKLFPLFLSLVHEAPSLGGAGSMDGVCAVDPVDGKTSKLWKQNSFLHSLSSISKGKSPLLVKQQDLEVLGDIGLRHVFFWRGYCRNELPVKMKRECNRTYQFLLQTLGEPVGVSPEVAVFQIPQHP